MERLPYIDEHAITIDADRANTWAALTKVVFRNPTDPGSVPYGFHLEAADAPARLALHGRHPFSRYRVVFDLDDATPGGTRVRATSWAAFPGLHGKAYRALVVGTGGHRVAVRHWLRRIAAAAR